MTLEVEYIVDGVNAGIKWAQPRFKNGPVDLNKKPRAEAGSYRQRGSGCSGAEANFPLPMAVSIQIILLTSLSFWRLRLLACKSALTRDHASSRLHD